ncbi:hypothetical protein CPB85DRAFT_1264818 [Mucidula mucida]|nr:hypothetical protein CPB85DRAFT_1264818 [Mucidula mucida]
MSAYLGRALDALWATAFAATPAICCWASRRVNGSQEGDHSTSLYPSNLRNTPSPTGGWRHDAVRALQYAIPSVEAHDTIDRAFLLYRRHVRKAREAELQRKFNCMNQAMEELAELEPHLYFEANKKEDLRERTPAEQAVGSKMKLTEQRALDARIRGLFPREMRVPTDTPSKNGWNYNWNPFPRPL